MFVVDLVGVGVAHHVITLEGVVAQKGSNGGFSKAVIGGGSGGVLGRVVSLDGSQEGVVGQNT